MNKERGAVQMNDLERGNIALGFVIGMLFGGLIDTFTGDSGIATIVGMILGSLIGSRMRFCTYLMEYPKQSIRNILITGSLFALVFISSYYLLNQRISKPFQILMVLAPIVPGIFFIASLGSAISKLDDEQRKIQEQALMLAFGLTGLITIVYGLFGMIGAPQPSWIVFPIIMTFSWLVGKIWFRLRSTI